MLIGHFTEQPWQDSKEGYIATFADRGAFAIRESNAKYDPAVGRQLYNRYLDEKLYAEEVGFDALMLNEHHSTPFCIQGVTNVEACILARETKKAKIIILGNILPIWDDPLWLAEQLAMVDMISHGRLVPGWVRGGGSESMSHNAPPTFNRERFEESHDFIVKAWTTPGPWRWEGKHHHYRYVNPWAMPLQKPHPQIWIPLSGSPETVKWCAQKHYPVVQLATLLPFTKEMFDLYHKTADELGYKSGTQNVGYLFKVHADETEEQAETAGRRYLTGVDNPFIAGNRAAAAAEVQQLLQLPGITSRQTIRRQAEIFGRLAGSGGPASRIASVFAPFEEQVKNYSIISGTPKSILPKVQHVLETLRPGTIFFWDGDGAQTHDDQVRSFRLMGQEVLPAVREMGKDMGLVSPYEVEDGTGYDQAAWRQMQAQGKS